MEKPHTITTDSAPSAIGPYSQAVRTGSLVFCSGQIALDAAGKLVGEGDVKTQTQQVMENLAAVLYAAGSSWHQVIRATIFLRDMGDFATVNEVYGSFVAADAPPARACVEVSRLPKDVLVEIDAIGQVG